jgi:hypothetical protein
MKLIQRLNFNSKVQPRLEIFEVHATVLKEHITEKFKYYVKYNINIRKIALLKSDR